MHLVWSWFLQLLIQILSRNIWKQTFYVLVNNLINNIHKYKTTEYKIAAIFSAGSIKVLWFKFYQIWGWTDFLWHFSFTMKLQFLHLKPFFIEFKAAFSGNARHHQNIDSFCKVEWMTLHFSFPCFGCCLTSFISKNLLVNAHKCKIVSYILRGG